MREYPIFLLKCMPHKSTPPAGVAQAFPPLRMWGRLVTCGPIGNRSSRPPARQSPEAWPNPNSTGSGVPKLVSMRVRGGDPMWNAGSGPRPRNRAVLRATLWLGLAALSGPAFAQSLAFDVRPTRLETEVGPGAEKTVAFRIQTEAASTPERDTLVLASTDWNIQEDGSVSYAEPGTSEDSASPWIQFSPTTFALMPAMNQLVRITIAVPATAAPGVYRTGIFVQARPPATPAVVKVPTVIVRVRYVYILYVIVPPVKAQPELTSVAVEIEGQTGRLQYAMKNGGNLHARPLIRWAIKNSQGELTGAPGEHEATVLLPQATLREFFQFPVTMPPGSYQMAVMVDFQDGEPLQSMTRPFEVPSK